MKLYTFAHTVAYLNRVMLHATDINKNIQNTEMQLEVLEANLTKLKTGYSIYEFIHALCDNINNPDGMFYTCIVACGRRIFHPILQHKALKQYDLYEIVQLLSGRRVRIYHITKHKNCNIKFGYIKLRALSNIEKDELQQIFQTYDLSALTEPICWKFIDSVGGTLWPNTVLQMHAAKII